MKAEKTRTMGEALTLHWWAAKMWWRIEPKLFLSTGLYAILDTVTPYVTIWLTARIVGELAGARAPDTLWRWVLLTVLVSAALKLATDGAYHWKEAVHALEIEQEDRMRVVKMMDLDFAAVDSTEFRELMFSVYKHQFGNVYGFSKVQSWYLETLVGGVASIVGAAALTASLFSQQVPLSAGTLAVMNSPWVNVAMVALLLAGVILSPLCEARSVSSSEKMWPYHNRYNRCFNFFALLGGRVNRAPDVRIYNMQVVAREAMEETYPLFPGRPAWRIFVGEWALFRSVGTAVSTLLVGLVYVFVCLKAWAGAFGVGYITQYVGAITRLCGGITQLFGALGDMRANSACLADLRRYMEIPNDMYQGSLTTEKRSDNQYEVEFRDVSFQYPGSESYALRHVNMKFQVGRRLAVVGQNGSGKTTFIKLLCRLYDPTEGEILLNGIDIRKYRYDDYMDIFSVVFQDFQLLSLPLGQNVASGQRYDADRVTKALEEAGFGPRLKEMPKGLDTYLYKDLDKDGVEISGGEAQKIAIARALYKKSAFLILDEPTAALDPVAEAEIYAHLNEIVGDRTCIYISHRLSSCRFCDDIAVFDHGGVVQQGSHETLVADEAGKYHELWYAQAQYYTE